MCLFEHVVGLADTHYGACAAELRCETAAFGFLDEYDSDKENSNDYCEDDYDYVKHYLDFCYSFFLFYCSACGVADARFIINFCRKRNWSAK